MSKNDTTKLAAIVEMARAIIAKRDRAAHLHGCGDRATNADIAAGFYEDAADEAGAMDAKCVEHGTALAAWVLAIAPALSEWAEARKAVAAAGEVIKATYRAAGPNRAPDVDSYSAAVSAWSDAKARLTDDEHALLAALASLDAQAVAP